MPVGERVECDFGSTVARAARLTAGTGNADEVIIAVGAFVLGQVLNFGSLVYVIDCYGQIHPHMEAVLVDNESPAVHRRPVQHGYQGPMGHPCNLLY